MSSPIPPSTLSTPRLTLTRLTDSTPGSQHLAWFHANWSDPFAASWRYSSYLPTPSSNCTTQHPLAVLLALKHRSLRGPTTSVAESRAWMLYQLAQLDTWFYAIFVTDAEGERECIGSVCLRGQEAVSLPPPVSFEGAAQVGEGEVLSVEELQKREVDMRGKDVRLRVLGYALFERFQGKGYVTEACRGLLDAYAAAIAAWRADGGEAMFYVEAGVDLENPGSQRVLRKLGFRTVGMKMEAEKAWLNGAWRGPGWWITGLYL